MNAPTNSGRSATIAAIALTAFLLLLFVNKPFHIDDPLFVWTAQHIQSHPIDFYGFDVHWKHTSEPMHGVMQNPPLLAYYLAIWASLFGWSEMSLHLAMIPWASLAAAALVRLCIRWAGVATGPWLAFMCIVSPAFLVSATQVMSDIPMFAAYLWGLYFWLTAADSGNQRRFALAVACACAAFLLKYFGATLVPLFVLHAWLLVPVQRNARWWSLVPLGCVALYEAATFALYGRGLLTDALFFATGFRSEYAGDLTGRLLTTTVFLGACWFPLGLLAIRRWRPWPLLGLLAVVVVGTEVQAFNPHLTLLPDRYAWDSLITDLGLFYSEFPVRPDRIVIAQHSLWLLLGVVTIAQMLNRLRQSRDAETVLLFAWLGGTLLFVVFFNHLVNARVLLPAIPAAAVLVLGKNGNAVDGRQWRIVVNGTLCAVAGTLSLAIALGDYRTAESHRAVALAILEPPTSENRLTYFTGHFGFQFYAESLGARPFDRESTALQPGDMLILPVNASWPLYPPTDAVRHLRTIESSVTAPVATMHYYTWAGFYADTVGPMPFVVGRDASELYALLEIVEPVPAGSIKPPEFDTSPPGGVEERDEPED